MDLSIDNSIFDIYPFPEILRWRKTLDLDGDALTASCNDARTSLPLRMVSVCDADRVVGVCIWVHALGCQPI